MCIEKSDSVLFLSPRFDWGLLGRCRNLLVDETVFFFFFPFMFSLVERFDLFFYRCVFTSL